MRLYFANIQKLRIEFRLKLLFLVVLQIKFFYALMRTPNTQGLPSGAVELTLMRNTTSITASGKYLLLTLRNDFQIKKNCQNGKSRAKLFLQNRRKQPQKQNNK